MMRSSLLLALGLVVVACAPADTAGTDARVQEDGGPPLDSGPTEDLDGGVCDCCGTLIGPLGDAGLCAGGACDPWCLRGDPCLETCDGICVFRHRGADAGPPPDGGTTSPPGATCVPRPSECEALVNCGGAPPNPSCDVSDPCFEALACEPQQVDHRGNLVDCLGA